MSASASIAGYEVRKWIAHLEEIEHEGGPRANEPLLKVAVGAVFRNPFAGSHRPDLSALTTPSGALATELARRGLALLGGRTAVSFGKGGIAGVAGEQEHVVACVTSIFGDALRASLGGGEAWISSFTKVGGAGEPIDIPLAHKDALYVRSHYDGITFSSPDVPRPDEILVCVGLASGPRIHERSGGITPGEIVGGGLR